MRYDRLQAAIFRKPFRPVRIAFDNGDSIVVRHPETVALNEWVLLIIRKDGSYVESEPEKVTNVEHLTSGNGTRRHSA